jgi:hypothetical protein
LINRVLQSPEIEASLAKWRYAWCRTGSSR